MTNRFIALIPARGGSKGLPRKNVAPVCGKPLIFWTIKAALSSKYISETFVTSDDEEILSISKTYGVNTILRSESLSRDDTLMRPVLLHAVSSLCLASSDILVLLQPTSPLREARDIDEAIEKFSKESMDGLISVVQQESSVLKYLWLNDGMLCPLINTETPFMRRQDLPLVFKPNGAIYMWKVGSLLKASGLWGGSMGYFEMTENQSVDIDTIDDLKYAQELLDLRLRGVSGQ